MRPFHVILHAAPPAPVRAATVIVQGTPLRTLDCMTAGGGRQLSVSFETAFEQLARLPRLFIELDGSFVWRGQSEQAWQVDGQIADREQRVQYVELKGRCPVEAWNALLACLRDEATPLVFQLVQEALFLEEQELQRWLWPPPEKSSG